MLAIYKSSGIKASITQILVASYVVILIPTVILALLTYMATEKESEAHQRHFDGEDIVQMLKDQQAFVKFGRFLREKSFPFTHPDPYHGNRNESKTVEIWAENLHDAQASIIYTWFISLVIALASFVLLAASVHRAFQRLTLVVEQLGGNRTDVQIDISGPADVQDLSKGLENLRLKLQNEDRLQQQFLRHISHEIKTPLTSIKEGSKLLDEQAIGEMNQEQQEIAKILVKSTKDLQGAIENLLNYNSVVAAADEKQRHLVSLKDLVEQALTKHELTIRNKKLTVKTILDESISSVDPEQMLTVFDNLISNAIKHSPRTSTISIWLQEKKGGKIGFIIKDQGEGVHSSQEQTIFKPFFVGKQNNKAPLRGTGLGLSIVKQYVESHDGEIKILKSRNGAAFQVTLPSSPLALNSV